MQSVSELMSPEPVFVRPTTSLPECGQLLEVHRIRHLPVVADEGEVIGLLNDFDVWAHGVTTVEPGGEPSWTWHSGSEGGVRIEDLMAPIEVFTRPDEGLGPLARRWKASRQDAAIVVDGRKHLLGIVTEHGVVAAAAPLLPAMLTTAHAGTTAPITAAHLGEVEDAWDRIEKARVRHLVLLSGTEVVGVASVRDLALLRTRSDWAPTAFVRHGPVYTVPEGTALRAVAELMAQHKIGLVPVLDHHGYLQRVISRRDVIAAWIAALEQDATFEPRSPPSD